VTVETDAATVVYGLYEYPDSPKISWDYRDDGSGSDGVHWAAVRLNGLLWCVLRGSVTNVDWRRDFEALPDPFLHDDLGLIHPGFYQGLPLVRERLLSLAKAGERIGVTGHSLGAGRAALLTGLLCVAGRAPLVRVCFGEPRSGHDTLANIVKTVTTWSYRNAGPGGPLAHDLVTDVPGYFEHPVALSDVAAPPAADDPWSLFAWHHMALYAKAVGITETWSG